MNKVSRVMNRRWLQKLIDDNGAVEVRVDAGAWLSGWFDNADDIAITVRNFWHCNMYTSINRPASPQVSNVVVRGAKAMRDKDATKVTRLFFDFDPCRPAKTASTEVQLLFARERAQNFVSDMSSRGWPRPAIAVSGNGYHLMYRAGFDEPEKFMPHWSRLYDILADKYSDDVISVDKSVKSLGQLTRLYGSINRKGQATDDKPHRLSSIWVPEQYDKIDPEVLKRTILEFGAGKEPGRPARPLRVTTPRSGGARGDYNTLDVVAWFTAHGLYQYHIKDNLHAVTCPWESLHSDNNRGDCIVRESTLGRQWPSFQCKHSHCQGQGIKEVIELLGDPSPFCGRVAQ